MGVMNDNRLYKQTNKQTTEHPTKITSLYILLAESFISSTVQSEYLI